MSLALEIAAQLAVDAWKRYPGVDPDALSRRMAELEEAIEEAARARHARIDRASSKVEASGTT